MEWMPIETAPKDGTEVIVGVNVADTWITRGAWFVNEADAAVRAASDDEVNPAEEVGWWSYSSSVTQNKLDGIYAPTHWCPMPNHQADGDPLRQLMQVVSVPGARSLNTDRMIREWVLNPDIRPHSFGPTGENLRASTLIMALQNLMAAHGDLKIGIYNQEFSSFDACDRVSVRKAKQDSFGDSDELKGPFFAVE